MPDFSLFKQNVLYEKKAYVHLNIHLKTFINDVKVNISKD